MFATANRAYLQAYYTMMRCNALACRKASRRIEAITRGDDTFRFACQALAASLFDITNAELTEVAQQLGAPVLGEEDEEEVAAEAPAAEAPAAEAAEQPAAEPAAEAPAEDMFASMASAPAGLTSDRATHLATIAAAQMEQKNEELDAAMAEEKNEECEKLSEEIEALEGYVGELKKFAAGEMQEEPAAPACFDENFATKSAGGDLFLGM